MLSKILWFFSGEEITYLQKLKAEANWSTRHLQITIFIFFTFEYFTVFVFLMNIFGKESDLPWLFTQEASQEGEKHRFINMHEQNVIGSQTQLNDIAYEHTKLFLGSYLQASWWILGLWKGRKICIGW